MEEDDDDLSRSQAAGDRGDGRLNRNLEISLEHVAQLPNLDNLHLDQTGVSDAGIESLATQAKLVVLSLRGGFDGLSAVAPVADPNLVSWRPTIALPANAAIQLDSLFGMHPALVALQPIWNAGNLAFVHAAAFRGPSAFGQ